MWISKNKYEELWDKISKLSLLAYALRKGEILIDSDGNCRDKLTYKELYEKSKKTISDLKNRLSELKDSSEKEKQAIIEEKNKLYELAYNKQRFGNTPYKELYEQQQNLANELSLKVDKLQRELDKKDNLKTYKLESGEEVKAQDIRVNEDWIEFIKDREVFKTVEKQEWELL